MRRDRSDLPAQRISAEARLANPRGCGNKVRYPGRKQATGALNALAASDPDDPDNVLLCVYKCRHGCHGWHVGHDRSKRRRAA